MADSVLNPDNASGDLDPTAPYLEFGGQVFARVPARDGAAGRPKNLVPLSVDPGVQSATSVAAVVIGTPFTKGACRWLSIGGGGHVAVQLADGTTAVFKNRQAGSDLFVQAVQVLTAGTTATDIVANY